MSVQPAAMSVNPSFTPAWSTTATPDWVFDDVAPELGEAPLKALLYIVRRTSGFRKSADAISLSQFQHGITTRDGRQLDKGAGIKNRTVLLRALDELEARGIIGHQDALRDDGGHATTIYYLLGPHHPLVRQPHPQQTDVPTNRKIERSMPPTPVTAITKPRTDDAAGQLAGEPLRAATGATPAPAAPPQRRLDADYQALAGPIAALVERLGDGAPPWASVSRGYGLMTRAGLDVPAFLALLAEGELLMRPSLPHIEKPLAYLFRVVESLMHTAPQPPRATTRPRSDAPAPAAPSPALAPPQTADAWGQVRAALADVLTPENYARWFAPTHQLHYTDGALTVAVPDAFHLRWLDERLRAKIEACAAPLLPGTRVLFVVEARA